MSVTDTRPDATVSADRPDGSTALGYQPALDGIRALAVVAVLMFHAEVPGFSGGYLGVSVFFTLSGFLITRLLIAESDRTGTVSSGRFYARRARRLLPASLLCIGAIVIASAVTTWFDGVDGLRRQALGALFQVENWVLLAGSGSYQELFERSAGAVSPFAHFWSLAIEEQFYWLWPVAFVLLLRVARTHASRTRVMAVATALFALAAPVIAAVWGPDAAYWATPARAAEILIGALLAFVLHRRTLDVRLRWLAPGALICLTVAVVTFPAAGGPAYDGALPLVAVVSATLLAGVQVDGPVRSALSVGWLVWIGRISYGVYLYHWPVYVVADADRTGLDGPALVALRLAITFAISVVSFYVIETPIRAGRSFAFLRSNRATLTVGAAAIAVAAAAAIVVVPAANTGYWRADASVADAAAIDEVDGTLAPLVAPAPATSTSPGAVSSPEEATPTNGATVGTGTSDTTAAGSVVDGTGAVDPVTVAQPPIPALSRPVRIVVAGDSTAEATGAGVVAWAAAHPDLAVAEVVGAPGCGFLMGGEILDGFTGWTPQSPDCATRLGVELPEAVSELQPDVVALMTTSWDINDRRWEDGVERTPLDAEFQRRLQADFATMSDRMLAAGAHRVVWIREPIPDPLWWSRIEIQEEPARHQAIYDAIAAEVERRPGEIYAVDLPAFLAESELDVDQTARTDGIHWTPEASHRIAEEFLGEQLIRAALDLDPR